jgi:hypothetical protein
MITFKDYLDEGKRGLWDNIHAKQERIKHGSGEKMRKPGSKGAPTAADFKASEATSKNEEVELQFDMIEQYVENLSTEVDVDSETLWEMLEEVTDEELLEVAGKWAKQAATAIAMKKAGKKPKNEEVELEKEQLDELKMGTVRNYMKKARTQLSNIEVSRRSTGDKKFGAEKARRRANTLNKIADKTNSTAVRDQLHKATAFVKEDAKGYKNPTGGLTQKGRDHYNNQTGGHLKAPVTTPPSKLKPGSKAANRRKSFCARMSGVEGPMKKPNGEPTRKALALRKWNC